MNIYPAIDIYNGQGVRLKKGDFNDMTIYGTPEVICEQWINDGATHLHIVDLNGARQSGSNLETILKLVQQKKIKVQVGGGIRNLNIVKRLLEGGVDRVIIGTAAIKDWDFVETIIKDYPEKVVLGIDAKNGYVAVEGWEEATTTSALDFIEFLEQQGVKHIVYTDIAKDGMLSGPNFEVYEQLNKKATIKITASGGITTLSDVKKLKAIGVDGVIIGKSLYENKITLKEALSC